MQTEFIVVIAVLIAAFIIWRLTKGSHGGSAGGSGGNGPGRDNTKPPSSH